MKTQKAPRALKDSAICKTRPCSSKYASFEGLSFEGRSFKDRSFKDNLTTDRDSEQPVFTVLDLNHFNITAPLSLVESLKHFYVDIVGLSVGARAALHHDGYWLYAVNSADSRPILHLSVCTDAQCVPEKQQGYFNHISLSCVGLVAAISKLILAGIPYKLVRVPSINLIQVFVEDPVGIGVELSFFNESLDPLL